MSTTSPAPFSVGPMAGAWSARNVRCFKTGHELLRGLPWSVLEQTWKVMEHGSHWLLAVPWHNKWDIQDIQSITILWQKALNVAMICRLWSLSWIVAVNFNRSAVLQHSAPKNPVLAKELAYFKGQKRPNLRKTGHGPPPKTTADGNGGYAVNSDRTPVAISKNLEHFLTCHVEGGPSRFYKYAWLLNQSRSQMGGMFSQQSHCDSPLIMVAGW